MLHGEKYIYNIDYDRINKNVQITTYIKASYYIDDAPSYKDVKELGYYNIYIRQVKDKHERKDGKLKVTKISDRRIEIKRVPACEMEALLKVAKLSYLDNELL